MNREGCSFSYSKYTSFIQGDRGKKELTMKREMNYIKKNQLELLETKNLISEMKILHGINNRFSSAEEMISELEDIGIEMNTK